MRKLSTFLPHKVTFAKLKQIILLWFGIVAKSKNLTNLFWVKHVSKTICIAKQCAVDFEPKPTKSNLFLMAKQHFAIVETIILNYGRKVNSFINLKPQKFATIFECVQIFILFNTLTSSFTNSSIKKTKKIGRNFRFLPKLLFTLLINMRSILLK